ncbi:MAG: class I tRNA ligase family protein, partial [Myxococcales bacterium]|nr:class I tRNA ligase family protein [Myxococcales bacterium]
DPDKVKAAGAKAALARKLVVAKDLVEALGKKLGTTLTVERVVSASELVDRAYLPPFTLYGERAAEVKTKDGKTVPKLWRVLAADFVTLDAGTGIVHIASAFGEDDHNAHRAELRRFDDAVADEMGLLCAIETDGTFVKDFGKYAGRWVKDCDKELSEELRERGLLVHAETYRHPYPFCWRADTDPLIQLARPAWYVRTTKEISKAIENNQTVQWLPDHIKTGRFGDFLANNVDWALSRERFWGTPLNVWVNDETGNMEAPASCAEIL